MRSIIVPAIAGAFSVVCYGLLKCTYIRRPMIEREEKRDLEEDNKDAMFDAEAYVEGLLTSTSDDKQSTRSAEDCYAVLNVLRKLHDQNPLDVQILKTLAVALFSLAYIPCLDVEYDQDEEWLHESKSLLEKALKIDKNDDSVKFELGRAHYYILESDHTVNQDSDLFMEHAISAYRYFKEVEDKGPEVYKFPMLDVLRKFMGRSMSNLEAISRNRKASSSALYHDNAEQTKKEYGDPSNIPLADVVCG